MGWETVSLSIRFAAKMVADAWCSARGMGHALAFGSASDVTGSIGASVKLDPAAVVVTCGE